MQYHISKSGSDINTGSFESPFLTIQRAADIAVAGDVITVHEGVYREWVNPKNGGTEGSPITYQAAEGEEVIITGAEVITVWEELAEGVWKTTISNTIFGSFHPYKEQIYGDWFFDKTNVWHLGEVYLEGKSMYESLSLDGVLHPVETADSFDPDGSLYTWYCEVEEEFTTIWANFHKVDPRIGSVEINVRKFVFWPECTGRDYITVRGFTLTKAATQWAPPTSIQEGLIGPHWSKGWVIENNIITDSKNVAVSLGKEISTGDNEWSKTGLKGGTQREREVIQRALFHANWSRDTIGHHIVRNNTIRDCEQAGIVGHLGCAFSVIEGNHIYNMHVKRQWHGAEVAGIKFHAAIDTKITDNVIHNTHRALWLDWQAQGTQVSRNVFYASTAEDMMVEVCHGPYLVDHNLFLSKWALKDMATGGAFAHNLFVGKIANCTEHYRYTPYHFPHDTAVYGVSNILGGDDRFYNNIFLKNSEDEEVEGLSSFWNGAIDMDGVPGQASFMQTPVGTSQYDAYPTEEEYPERKGGILAGPELPVYIADNLYLGGAKPYRKEVGAVESDSIAIEVSITDQTTVVIQIQDPEIIKQVDCELVTTKRLGMSYQAEMGYEEPDGSDIMLDTDIIGVKRKRVYVGPFAEIDGQLTLRYSKDRRNYAFSHI